MATHAPPLYSYRPLDRASSIRILVLRPAPSFEDPLQAELVHADREAILDGGCRPNSYEAVSYCWGDPNFSLSIEIGRENLSSLAITENVDHMLRHLRKKDKVRNLWIDAICLNQQDFKEKDVQVQLMKQIFQQATKVQIWLGRAEGGPDPSFIFHMLKTFAIYSRNVNYDNMTLEQEYRLRQWAHNSRSYLDVFLSRPWFGRRWILQEAAFGKDVTVQCGEQKLNWAWFVEGISAFHDTRSLVSVPWLRPTTVSAIETVLSLRTWSRSSLLDLLWQFHGSECSDSRDRVYAILGMATDAAIVTRAKYSQHFSDIFAEVVKAYIPDFYPIILKHLACFGSLSRQNPHYPSWVPDWTRPRERNSLFELHDTERRNLGHNPHCTVAFINERVLRITAIYSGRVETIGEPRTDLATEISTHLSKSKHIDLVKKAIVTLLFHALRNNPIGPIYGDIYSGTLASVFTRLNSHSVMIDLSSDETLQNAIEKYVDKIHQGGLTKDDKNIVIDFLESTLLDRTIFSVDGLNGFGIGTRDMQDGDLLIPHPHFSRRQRNRVFLGFIFRPLSLMTSAPNVTGTPNPSAGKDNNFRFVGHSFFKNFQSKPFQSRIIVDVV